jgi:hypothetical protein
MCIDFITKTKLQWLTKQNAGVEQTNPKTYDHYCHNHHYQHDSLNVSPQTVSHIHCHEGH